MFFLLSSLPVALTSLRGVGSWVRSRLWPPAPYWLGRCQFNMTCWDRSLGLPALSRVWQHLKLSDVSLGTCPRYSLVVDEDVKKPTNQPIWHLSLHSLLMIWLAVEVSLYCPCNKSSCSIHIGLALQGHVRLSSCPVLWSGIMTLHTGRKKRKFMHWYAQS